METLTEKNFKIRKSETIVEVVSSFYSYTPEQLIAEGRSDKMISGARFIAFYFVRKYVFPVALKRVGKVFNRHHATVIHGLKRVEAMKQQSKIFVQELDLIGEEVKKALASRIEEVKQKKSFIKKVTK